MSKKISFDGKEYEYDGLSDLGKVHLKLLTFSTQKITELNNLQALLQRAKNSYVDSLKKEMLSQKSGFLFNDD
jgi:hypothetical protein